MRLISIFSVTPILGGSTVFESIQEVQEQPYPRCPHVSAPMGAGTIVGRGGKAEPVELIKSKHLAACRGERTEEHAARSAAGLVYCSTTAPHFFSLPHNPFWDKYLGLFRGSSLRYHFAPEWYHCVGELSWQ